MKDNIKPPIVLTVICVVASLLLVFAHELTKENIAEQKALRFNASVEALFGKTDCVLIDNNFGEVSVQAIAALMKTERFRVLNSFLWAKLLDLVQRFVMKLISVSSFTAHICRTFRLTLSAAQHSPQKV